MKAYKRQIEEAEEIAAINLAKFRKAADDKSATGAEGNSIQVILSNYWLIFSDFYFWIFSWN